jgi:hypothetical protein
VKYEAVELGLTRAAGGDVTEVRLVAEAADAGAGAGTEGDTALDGGADEAGPDRRGLGKRVGRCRVVGGLEVAAGEQLPDVGADGSKDVRHLLVARWRCGVKGELPWQSSLKMPSSTSVCMWMLSWRLLPKRWITVTVPVLPS